MEYLRILIGKDDQQYYEKAADNLNVNLVAAEFGGRLYVMMKAPDMQLICNVCHLAGYMKASETSLSLLRKSNHDSRG